MLMTQTSEKKFGPEAVIFRAGQWPATPSCPGLVYVARWRARAKLRAGTEKIRDLDETSRQYIPIWAAGKGAFAIAIGVATAVGVAIGVVVIAAAPILPKDQVRPRSP